MNQSDEKKIENIINDREVTHKKFIDTKSDVYKAFLNMEKAAFKDGALLRKEKELIALGISLAINCESCMEWHIKQAIHSGATFGELIEAIEVAIEMGGGPATVSSRFALKVLEYYREQ